MKEILVIILAIIGVQLTAQEVVENYSPTAFKTNVFRTLDDRLEGKRLGASKNAKLGYGNVNGNPYLFKEERNCKLQMKDGYVVENATIQYDLNKNVLIASLEDYTDIVLDNSYYHSFQVQDEENVRMFTKEHPVYGNDFFEVLFRNADFTFFKKERSRIKSITYNTVGEIKTVHKFKRYIQYYIKDSAGEVTDVKLKKGYIMTKLPEASTDKLKQQFSLRELKRMNTEERVIKTFKEFL